MERIVLITGCSTGIGRSLAEAFQKNGDLVLATARRLESIADLMAIGCKVHPLDVNDESAMAGLIQRVEAKYGRIDVLINNAGVNAVAPVVEIPATQLRSQFETNVIGPALLVQKALPLLRKSHGATIVNIGSVSASLTTPFAGPYCASKAALHSISEAMRLELRPLGIRVLLVTTGAIQSDLGSNATRSIKQWLTEKSLYYPVREGILARARASQENAMPASEYATRLLKVVNTPGTTSARLGKGALFFELIGKFMPRGLRTRMLNKKFGLEHARLS